MYNIMSWDNKFRVPVSPYSVCSFSFFLKVNGVNLLKVSCAKCICIWAHVARHLFSRGELKRSLIFSSKKSEKSTLDPKKVELLLSKLSTEC